MSKARHIVDFAKSHPKMSTTLIGERFGVHPAYVRAAMHRAGVFRRAHDPSVIYLDASKGLYVRLPAEEYRLLKAALKPFADAAARFAPYPGQMEEKEVNAFFTLSQLRAASAALNIHHHSEP